LSDFAGPYLAPNEIWYSEVTIPNKKIMFLCQPKLATVFALKEKEFVVPAEEEVVALRKKKIC